MRNLVSMVLAVSLIVAPAVAQKDEEGETGRSRHGDLSLEPARTVSFTTTEGTYMNLDVSPDGGTLYVANWTAQDISVIDLETGAVTRKLASVPTPRSLYATSDGAYLYVAGFEGGEIQKIALDTGLGRIVFDDGGAVAHLAGDEKRGVLYASDMALGVVWQLDLETDEVTQLATTDQKPNTIDLSPDGAVIFVACRGANNEVNFNLPGPQWGTVLLIDPESGEPVAAAGDARPGDPLEPSPRLSVATDRLWQHRRNAPLRRLSRDPCAARAGQVGWHRGAPRGCWSRTRARTQRSSSARAACLACAQG